MVRRSFAANQLLMAEDEMSLLTRWSDEVGMQLGVLADSIHFDGADPVAVDGLLAQVEAMRITVERAVGLIAAYEIHRRSEARIREARRDHSSAG